LHERALASMLHAACCMPQDSPIFYLF